MIKKKALLLSQTGSRKSTATIACFTRVSFGLKTKYLSSRALYKSTYTVDRYVGQKNTETTSSKR